MKISTTKVTLFCILSIITLGCEAETISSKVASEIVSGKFKKALKSINTGAKSPTFLKDDLTSLLTLNKIVARKYAEKIGQQVDFYARKRLKRGTLLKVEKGVVYIKVTTRKASAKWPIRISSLPLGFRFTMAEISKSAKNLYMGVKSLRSRDFFAAKACFGNIPKISEALMNAANDKYGKIYSMTKACFSGDADSLTKLLAAGGYPNAEIISYMRNKRTHRLEKRNSSLLIETIKRRQAKTAVILIQNGANPDKADSKEITPLMYSVIYFPKDMSVAKALIAKKADITIKDKSGNSALSGAIALGRLPAFKLLLSNGADINALTGRGFTPLMMAVGSNNYAMFKILMDKGADPSVVHAQGWTVLDMNRSRMDPRIKAILDQIAPLKKKRKNTSRGFNGLNVIQRK